MTPPSIHAVERVRPADDRGSSSWDGDTADDPARLEIVVDEFDSPTEVDAAFRTQRRAAIGYFVLFAVGTFSMPALTIALPWWSQARLVGGMSPAFVMAAGGLYVLFFVVALAAALLANGVEDAMLGGRADRDDAADPGSGNR